MKKSKINPKPSYIFSILSVALLLFMMLTIGSAWLHSREWLTQVKENLNLAIELKAGIEHDEIAEIKHFLDKMDETISSSYNFISKESAFDAMKSQFGNDLLSDDFPNPLHDMITINIKEEYMTTESLQVIETKIKNSHTSIEGVFFQDQVLSGSMSNINKIIYIALCAVFLMFIIALTLIHNTVKLSLYANRHLIKNMDLVGAKAGFIIAPFLKKSFWHGTISTILALLFLVGTGYFIYTKYPDISQFTNFPKLGGLIIIVFMFGILINVLSTGFIVRKYLRLRLNEIF